MSEVKLNLVDAQRVLSGTIHGALADTCVAALSAEPYTIEELEAALDRFIKPQDDAKHFACFQSGPEIDPEPWDAGIVIIDLLARVVAVESTYSQPGPEGEVRYHDGTQSTDVAIPYLLSHDWLFVNSVEAYSWSSDRRRQERTENPPLDTRAILYGPALVEYIVKAVAALAETGVLVPIRESEKDNGDSHDSVRRITSEDGERSANPTNLNGEVCDSEKSERLAQLISRIHARWLMTPREDLLARSPREVLLEKQEFIDFDLHTRCLQWTFLGEGPPCLARDSFAYRFAGFGTHEWVVYYDLCRHLLWSAAEGASVAQVGMSQGLSVPSAVADGSLGVSGLASASVICTLEQIKTEWLENGDSDYEGRVPANIIENERRRLPQAMSPKELIINEDCECCRMLARDAEMGLGPTFWHLDGSHMDDEFAFSSHLTIEEWETEKRRREEFNREFERDWAERQQRIARGEIVDDEFDLDWIETPQREQPF